MISIFYNFRKLKAFFPEGREPEPLPDRLGPARKPSPTVTGPLLLAVMVLSMPSVAADSISGTYIEGTQKVSVKIESWGEDCGPQPKSYSKKGGKKVTVELKGDNLFFSDGSSTKNCWSANTRLKRLSATKKGNAWTTICETPPNDSRFERGEYTVKETENGLLFVNKSSYNWQLKTSICKATITIKKDYTLVGVKKEPVTEPEPPVKDKAKCKSPGVMEKLVIAPAKARLGAGEKVCFSVYGLDGNGCRLQAPDYSLSLSAPVANSEGSLDKNCFTAGTNAALSEGTFRIVASAGGGLTDSAKVEVKFGDIEDLIAVNLSPTGLAGDEDDESTVPHAMPPSGFIEISSPDEGRHILLWVLGLSAAGILLLGGIIVIAVSIARMKTAKRKIMRTVVVDESETEPVAVSAPAPAKAARAVAGRFAKEEPHTSVPAPVADARPVAASAKEPKPASHLRPASRDSDLKRMWMHCRVCGGDFAPGSLHCPQDGSKLIPYRDVSYKSAKSGLICPACRRGYPNDYIQCPDDKEYLIPYSVFRVMKADDTSKKGKGKICPVCQKTYDDSEVFCAEDGSKLENVQ